MIHLLYPSISRFGKKVVNPNSIGWRQDRPNDATHKFSEECPCSHNDNTASIKLKVPKVKVPKVSIQNIFFF